MPAKLKNIKLLQEFLPFLWVKEGKIRSLFLLSFILIFISIGLNLSIPIILKEIIAIFSTPVKSMTYQLSLLLVAYGVIWIISQTVQRIRQIIMVRPLERCIRIFCSKLFDHLHSLPMQFHLNKKTGAVTNALERAQHGFPNVFWGLFLFVIPTFIEVGLASVILCYYYGLIYGVILFSVATVFIIFTLYATEWSSHLQTLSNDQQSNTNAYIVDSLLNFTSVKYFNNKQYEVFKCDKHLKEREKVMVKFISSMELIHIVQGVIVGCGIILLTFLAGKQALLDIYGVSDFILINGYILQFAVPLGHMGFIVQDIRKGMNELSSVIEILKTSVEPPSPTEKINVLEKLENIKFQNASFGYEPSRLIFKNVSFELKIGKVLGIVGKTGSGKSTIANLLFRFYDINSGKIFINSKNIKSFTAESITNLIGIVPQDITLFNTTIYENILFANPNASKEEVEKVIELAHLDLFLKKLPRHYDTDVGERGLKLSGGEKQRIAIARILLKKPSLYIFDEATSSLDCSTERIVMASIKPFMEHAMSIIIAHRLSTIINADEILVFHNGIIKERGTHLSLLEQKGIYASLWQTQERANN